MPSAHLRYTQTLPPDNIHHSRVCITVFFYLTGKSLSCQIKKRYPDPERDRISGGTTLISANAPTHSSINAGTALPYWGRCSEGRFKTRCTDASHLPHPLWTAANASTIPLLCCLVLMIWEFFAFVNRFPCKKTVFPASLPDQPDSGIVCPCAQRRFKQLQEIMGIS